MKQKKQDILTEKKAERFLESHGIPAAEGELVNTLSRARQVALKLKYPVILKIISPQALHKTEINGVRIADDETSLIREFNSLMLLAKRKRIKLDGILVQEKLHGLELIFGIKKDPIFGHALMLGIGGVFVEILKDVSFRICPITEKDVNSMIEDLKSKKLLAGVRGEKPVNMKQLKQVLVRLSKIPLKDKNLEELDINPFIIDDKKGKVADARIVFS
ncbi:acetate--CoA ligase family protein [Candidatus Woesearchaeota archaeon]|nr:acetate--CoA ligase family protein [Candidatus Woesearchaeota archaeon]